MTLVLAFAAVLLVAVLASGLAARTVLSTAVIFLVAGFVLGDGVLGVITVRPGDNVTGQLAELALFSVLFTDGMGVGLGDLRSAWRLPGRALVLGMPLTLVATAGVAHFVAGVPWTESLLIGAALAPTDPVFAAAIVGREDIPYRLRHLLNVESGLNDGLALPVVVVLLAVVGSAAVHPGRLLAEVTAGLALGVVVPAGAVLLVRSRFFSPTAAYEPLNAFAIGLLVLAVASLTHANEFLAAFAGGITVATLSPEVRDAFHEFGELVTELLKLAALLVFGALISPAFLAAIPGRGYAFAVVALLFTRPAALAVSLIGSRLSTKEWLAAAWFGPKGFASVVYGLLILRADFARNDAVFHLIALVVVASIVAHSSTDVVIARWFQSGQEGTERDSPTGSRSATT